MNEPQKKKRKKRKEKKKRIRECTHSFFWDVKRVWTRMWKHSPFKWKKNKGMHSFPFYEKSKEFGKGCESTVLSKARESQNNLIQNVKKQSFEMKKEKEKARECTHSLLMWHNGKQNKSEKKAKIGCGCAILFNKWNRLFEKNTPTHAIIPIVNKTEWLNAHYYRTKQNIMNALQICWES